MSVPIRVLLADDHPVFRKGLRGVLEEASDITVVAEAGNGDAALAMVREHRPDIIVLDLDMPDKDGIEVARAVRDEKLATQAVLLTAHKSEALVNRALDSGVSGYVLKDGALTEIVDCVRAVHARRPWVSAQLATVLLTRRDRAEKLADENTGLGSLTATERRVLTLVARGSTSREIGEAMFISVRTVEHHRANIALKLGLKGSNASSSSPSPIGRNSRRPAAELVLGSTLATPQPVQAVDPAQMRSYEQLPGSFHHPCSVFSNLDRGAAG